MISVVLLAGLMLNAPEARAAGTGQWKLAEGGATCFYLVADSPVDGPRITASRQVAQVAYGAPEVVYADVTGGGMNVGDRWQVVRNTGPIEHPATHEVVGQVLEVLGLVEIIDVNADVALVRVDAACREFEIGDQLRPAPTEEVEMPEELPRLPLFNADALIVPAATDAFVIMGALESVLSDDGASNRESVTSYEMYAQRDLIVIDQGTNQQWQLADMATLYRDRIYANSDVFRDAIVEPLILGRGVVVRADASSAVLQITDAVLEMHIGDRVRKTGTALDYVNHAPSVTCRSERLQVRTGESVRLTAEATDPDGDDVVISWVASAGVLSAETGDVVTWTAQDLADGAMRVTATVDDGRGGTDDCQIAMSVGPAPAGARFSETEAGAEVLEFTCPEFPSGSTVIDNRCKALLDDVALRLRQNPNGRVEIVGHSDTSGSDEVNQAMSQGRADNARDYLVETHGVDAGRIQTAGAGSTENIVGNETAEDRLRNRRVEIRVILPGGDG